MAAKPFRPLSSPSGDALDVKRGLFYCSGRARRTWAVQLRLSLAQTIYCEEAIRSAMMNIVNRPRARVERLRQPPRPMRRDVTTRFHDPRTTAIRSTTRAPALIGQKKVLL
jgi:hypothetical protein